MFLLITWNMLCFVAAEFTERQLKLRCSLYHKVQKMLLEISAKSLKTRKEFFPTEGIDSRPANNNDFLQGTFSEIKIKLLI